MSLGAGRFARATVGRPGWRLEVVDAIAGDGPLLPVFTHLLHEQTFLSVKEARRVLQPGGKIVFFIFTFASDSAQQTFANMVAQLRNSSPVPLNMHLGRTAGEASVQHLDLRIDEFRGAVERFVPLPQPITLDGGGRMEGLGTRCKDRLASAANRTR